jgi:hypothetical protein
VVDTPKDPHDLIRRLTGGAAHGVDGHAGHVGRYDTVVDTHQRRCEAAVFVFDNVHGGERDGGLRVRQGRGQSMFVHEPTSGRVDEYRAWFHRGELVGADEMAAGRGQRSVQGHHIGSGQQLV